jgi:hypothetical protein
MRLTEVGIKNYKSATILNESWQELTEAQQVYIGRWETNVWPLVEQYSRLMEAELTADQIQQIFTSAEQAATDSGDNTTALGKAGKVTAEISSKMKTEIEKLAKQAKDSGVIDNVDQKFAKLQQQLKEKLKGTPNGQKVLSAIEKWKGYAEENPAKSAFIIGAMTSILAFASGGVVSGAAIGFFLRLANNTIKGDTLSKAASGAVKTAALGALVGGLADVFTADVIDIETPANEAEPAKITTSITSDEVADAAKVDSPEEIADAMPSLQAAKDLYAERISEVIGTGPTNMSQEMLEKISDTLVVEGDYPNNYKMYLPEGSSMARGEIFMTPDEAAAYDKFMQGKDMSQILGQEGTDWLKANVEGADELLSGQEADAAAQQADLKAKYDAMSPEEQKAYDQEQESKYGDFMDYTPPGTPKYESVNVEDLWDALDAYELREAPNFMAALGGAAKGMKSAVTKGTAAVTKAAQSDTAKKLAKGAGSALDKAASMGSKAVAKGIEKGTPLAKKAGDAISAKAKEVGHELGNKVTANKLNRMWKKSGSPTDTGSIVNILVQAGLSDELIGTVSKETGVTLDKTMAVDLQALADEIKKAGVADKIKAALSAA